MPYNPREKRRPHDIDPRDYVRRGPYGGPGFFCCACGSPSQIKSMKDVDPRNQIEDIKREKLNIHHQKSNYFHKKNKNKSYFQRFCERKLNLHLLNAYFGKEYMFICTHYLGLNGRVLTLDL